MPSRAARPLELSEVTLSPELRTVGLLRPHVWVGYQWSHTGLCPGRKTSHNRYIRSFVSQSPQNCTGAVSTHAAQALNNAPARYDRAQLRWPTTPLTGRGCPIGLGVNLDVTATGPAPEIGGGRTSEDRYDPADRSALPPAPVGCRFTSANTRGKSARFRAG